MQLYHEYLTELASFVHVVELGTFAAAAREEGVPKSTVTRRIARLEEALGVALLRRAPRSFTVSDDGRALYDRCVGALRELSAATQSVAEMSTEPAGKLVVTAPPDFGDMPSVLELLVQARARFPKLVVDLRLEQRVVDLLREDVDLAIRPVPAQNLVGETGSLELISRRLTRLAGALFASRGFVDEYGLPGSPDLRDFPTVFHRAMVLREFEMEHESGEVAQVQFGPAAVVVNDFELVRGLVRRGMGVGILWDEVGRSDPELVRLLDDWSVFVGELRLMWPATRHLSPRVRAFVDLAVEVFARCPDATDAA